MSRFEKLTHVLWHCQYHLVWVPKYRYRVLKGPVGQEVYNCVQVFCGQLGCLIVELNVQVDHVHLLVRGERSPEKASILAHGRTSNHNFGAIHSFAALAVIFPPIVR